jgi:hypothetical protein
MAEASAMVNGLMNPGYHTISPMRTYLLRYG